jgi:hypothetical protein
VFGIQSCIKLKFMNMFRPPGSTGTLSSLLAREAAPRGVVKPQQPLSSLKPAIPQLQQRVIPGMPAEMAARKVKPSKAQPEVKLPASSSVKVETRNEVKPAKVSSKPSTPAALAVVATPTVLTAEDKEKKAKGIEKKLRQIEEIEQKRASGTQLNSDQVISFLILMVSFTLHGCYCYHHFYMFRKISLHLKAC